MNIGIMTLHLHRNYGGILQNYALQQILSRLGHNPITIDKRPARNNLKFAVSYLKHTIIKALGRESEGIYYYEHTHRGGAFAKFVNKYINKTRSTARYTEELINKYKLEALIIGSDQVWRRAFFTDGNLKNYYGYFLAGNSIPRIAYAASFGVDSWEYEPELTTECGKLASKFKAISTREDSGIELCKNLGVMNAVGVLDPTMMLSAQDYLNLCEPIPVLKKGVLFAYILSNDANDIATVKKIAIQRNLTPLIVGAEFHATLSVEEWIAYFRDCEYVVTDSFHGTVFSILFKKEFNTIINQMRGGDRFYSLLNRLQLTNRIITDNSMFEIGTVDWDKIERILTVWRNKSMTFLETALSNISQ